MSEFEATKSDKYSLDDGRHYENPYSDYSVAIGDGTIDRAKRDLDDTYKVILLSKIKDLIRDLELHKKEWYGRDDFSVYTGTAGIAQMYWHVGKLLKEPSYAQRASELLQKSLACAKGNRRVSYLAGSAGPFALATILHYEIGNEAESQKALSQLHSLANTALAEASNELLYGKVGYLYALLFVKKSVPSHPVDEGLIKQIIDAVLTSGREYSISRNHECPLMYEWHEKEYLGGAHGLAGILYVLLQAREYLTESQLGNEIKPSLDYLKSLQYESGNFPSSLGNKSDKLVHWCHGAPSMSMLFTHAHKVFGDESYLQTAYECAEAVWSRGLLRKGYGMCHGVSGNAYTFICLYQSTRNSKYLYRACKFAKWCTSYGKRRDRNPDRPYSLFEGLAGTIYFLADLCQPELAKFPAYSL